MVEGESEEVYFNRIARMSDSFSIVVKISKDKRCKDIILNCAKEAARLGLENDDMKVAVFDLDVVDGNELDEAIALAEKEGVLIMASNLSFEVWLLMHLEEVSHVYTQKDYEDRLSVLLGSKYRKSKGLKEKVNPGSVQDAIRRGRIRLDSYDALNCKTTPNSSVLWYLLSLIFDS